MADCKIAGSKIRAPNISLGGKKRETQLRD